MAAREPKKTPARPRRTKKLALPAEPASQVQVTPEPAPVAPEPTSERAVPVAAAPTPRVFADWVPIVYDGAAVFSHAEAGVFVTGTRTRLRPRLAERLLRCEGFRLAG